MVGDEDVDRDRDGGGDKDGDGDEEDRVHGPVPLRARMAVSGDGRIGDGRGCNSGRDWERDPDVAGRRLELRRAAAHGQATATEQPPLPLRILRYGVKVKINLVLKYYLAL